MTGMPAEKFFSDVNADKLFLAVTGVASDKGFSDQNMFETPVKMKMIERASEIIVLADNSKFGRTAFSPIGDLSIAHKVVTDIRPDESICESIKNNGVDLIVCSEK